MAKGTRVRDVNFSVPEGADPLGIGGLDLGKSSYDPLETIRRGWEANRQGRKEKEAVRRAEYDKFLDMIPSYSTINQKVGDKLNVQREKLFEKAKRLMEAGEFAPLVRDEKGAKAEQSLTKEANDLIRMGQLYNESLPVYEASEKYINDPRNEGKWDEEETLKNRYAYGNAETPEEMRAIAAGGLVVKRPDPVKLIKNYNSAINAVFKDPTRKLASEEMDPITGKMRLQFDEKMTPQQIRQGMGQVWDMLPQEDRNEWERKFENAPDSQISDTIDGVQVPKKAKDWFAEYHHPIFGEDISVQYVAPAAGAKKSAGDVIPKNELGEFVYEPETRLMAPVTDGKAVNEPIAYDSMATLPLGEDMGSFNMVTTLNSYNAETGELAEPGRAAKSTIVDASILPSAPMDKDVTVTLPDGTEKTINKGDKMDRDVYRQLVAEGRGGEITYKPFISYIIDMSKRKVEGTDLQKQMEEIIGPKFGSKILTIIAPYDEVRRYMRRPIDNEGWDITELDDYMNQKLGELGVEQQTTGTTKDQAAEKTYEDLYK